MSDSTTETMRAMTYDTYGGTDVLSLTQQPLPKVGPSEVLVRVRSASVNPVDWKLMSGGLDAVMHAVFPVVPGWDVSGVVEAVGFDTSEFAVGDEVMAYNRKDYLHGGTFAELTTVPVRSLAKKPASLSWDEAAGLPLAGLTAWQLLTRLEVGEGDTVLIHAAAGGVGSLGVQIAKALGARVIGTASAGNHDRLRELGAEPVEYGDGVVDRVRALAPDGVDVVADFVGGVLETTQAVLAAVVGTPPSPTTPSPRPAARGSGSARAGRTSTASPSSWSRARSACRSPRPSPSSSSPTPSR